MKVLAAAALSLCALGAQADKPPRLLLVGDSTLAPRNGYGDALCARFQPGLQCLNLAKNGRSSGSYRAEGSWQQVMALLQSNADFSATYVMIEFGHNDQPGKPGRSTDLRTEFPANLARFVDEVRASGATPVLATPLTRRSFKDGLLVDDLALWAQATRTVAQDKQVPLVDLLAASRKAVQAMGQAEADTLAVEPPVSAAAASAPQSLNAVEAVTTKRSAFDRTHVGPKGAALFANIVAPLLREAVPALAPQLKPE
jgi:lysophospholipase L1-like esterase